MKRQTAVITEWYYSNFMALCWKITGSGFWDSV